MLLDKIPSPQILTRLLTGNGTYTVSVKSFRDANGFVSSLICSS